MENHFMYSQSIVLVPFPFDDFSNSKVRPALCLTGEISKYNQVVIAFISSKISDDVIDSDIIIKKNSDNWMGTGLTVDSVIRLHKIVTIPTSLIKRRLGKVNSSTATEIKAKIKRLFDLA